MDKPAAGTTTPLPGVAAPAFQDGAGGSRARQGAGAAPAARAWSVHPAAPEDHTAIRRLLGREHFDTRGVDPACFMVARLPTGAILGCAQVKPVGGERVLSSVVVDPAARRQGVGRALVGALLARERGTVFLMCIGSLAPYYQAFGFQPTAARRAPFGLYWRWAILALLGRVIPGGGGAVIMIRSPLPPEKKGINS
jgi:N-acetylglutamate synthase-like GNAT family acetyltransferase